MRFLFDLFQIDPLKSSYDHFLTARWRSGNQNRGTVPRWSALPVPLHHGVTDNFMGAEYHFSEPSADFTCLCPCLVALKHVLYCVRPWWRHQVVLRELSQRSVAAAYRCNQAFQPNGQFFCCISTLPKPAIGLDEFITFQSYSHLHTHLSLISF